MVVFYCIAVICLTIIAILYIEYKRYECDIKTYNANIQGWMLVKGDHICDRVGAYSKCVKLHNNLISAEDFLKFINSVELIIRDELVYRRYRKESEEVKQDINKVDGSKRNKQHRIKQSYRTVNIRNKQIKEQQQKSMDINHKKSSRGIGSAYKIVS